jgi:hypothetical protein
LIPPLVHGRASYTRQLIDITVSLSPLKTPVTFTRTGLFAVAESLHFLWAFMASCTRALPTSSKRTVWPSFICSANWVAPEERAQLWPLPAPEVWLVDEAAERSPEDVPVRSAEPLCVLEDPLPVEPAVLPLCVVDEPLPVFPAVLPAVLPLWVLDEPLPVVPAVLPVVPAVLPLWVVEEPLPIEPAPLPVEFIDELMLFAPEPMPAQDASTKVPE